MNSKSMNNIKFNVRFLNCADIEFVKLQTLKRGGTVVLATM